jgi:hypothetical protein
VCGGGSKLNKIGHHGGTLGNLIVDELQLVITSFQWLAHWQVLRQAILVVDNLTILGLWIRSFGENVVSM